MAFTVIYDACVLYGFVIRDLLIEVALTDLFRARWTEQILDECFENLLDNNPHLNSENLARTRTLMNQHVRDALVNGYEDLIDGLQLPDADDRHVLAAAIKAGAGVIVTFNLDDFPEEALEAYGIEAQHPDEFIHNLHGLDAEAVWDAVQNCRRRLESPPYSQVEYLDILERAGLRTTVGILRVAFGAREEN